MLEAREPDPDEVKNSFMQVTRHHHHVHNSNNMKAIIRSEFEMFKLKSDDDIEFDFEENQCDVDEFVEDREKF